MSDPVSIWSGSFRLFGVDIDCHVLDDGRRIIEAQSMAKLLHAMEHGGQDVNPNEVARFAKWQKGVK